MPNGLSVKSGTRTADANGVLTWLALAAVLGAVGCTVRWLARRQDALGRSIGYPRISVALLTVVALAAAYPGIARRHEEARLGKVASVVAGTGVHVKCQTLGGAAVDAGAEAGYVKWGPDGRPEHVAHIKWEQCKLLRAYLSSDKHHPSQDQYVAVHVLTHEAVHAGGVRSESVTECRAVQRDVTTARLLGASDTDARVLARLYWKTVYPLMPDDYRDAGCGPDGALDEHLATSPWVAGA